MAASLMQDLDEDKFKHLIDFDRIRRNKGLPLYPIHNEYIYSYRFFYVNGVIYRRPKAETTHEFLINLLKWTCGKSWLDAELARPPEDMHQIVKWLFAFQKWKQDNLPDHINENDLFNGPVNGYCRSLVSLAYDVYILKDQNSIPDTLVDRLISHHGFQGARHEIRAASLFIRSGSKLEWIDKKSMKHCEFYAVDPLTNEKIAVEAKSRHRRGVLGQPGDIEHEKIIKGDIGRLLHEALQQSPGDLPFIVLIDVNVPPDPEGDIWDRRFFRDYQKLMRPFTDPGPDKQSPFNAIVLTNASYHYHADSHSFCGEWVFDVSPYPQWPLINRERLTLIMCGMQSYGMMPPGP